MWAEKVFMIICIYICTVYTLLENITEDANAEMCRNVRPFTSIWRNLSSNKIIQSHTAKSFNTFLTVYTGPQGTADRGGRGGGVGLQIWLNTVGTARIFGIFWAPPHHFLEPPSSNSAPSNSLLALLVVLLALALISTCRHDGTFAILASLVPPRPL